MDTTVIDDNIMFLTDEVWEYIKNYTIDEGDVYITNVGACIGDCGIVPHKYHKANLTENAVKLTNIKCNNKFLAYYISSTDVQDEIKGLTASATLGKLSIANIKKIVIKLPPECEQNEIVRILDSIMSELNDNMNMYEKTIRQIDVLKKSILAKAFRGELGTNEPADGNAIFLLKKIFEEECGGE